MVLRSLVLESPCGEAGGRGGRMMVSMGLMMQPFSADKITLANPLNLECDRMYHKKMTVRETDKFYGNSASRNAIHLQTTDASLYMSLSYHFSFLLNIIYLLYNII